jgi:Pyridoxamine 5'-phosphate oxidase
MTRAVAPGAEGARAIIAGARYMTLATADAEGVPWATPVWYAPRGYAELFWVSYPDARHSRNLALRPELSIVIFDTTVTPGDGQAVYMEATAAESAEGLEVFSARSVAQGLGEWRDLRGPLRLFRAVVSQHWMLGEERDERVPVSP